MTNRDSIARNRGRWDDRHDSLEAGRQRWAAAPTWGIWNVPEIEFGLLSDCAGRDTLELGCGTGYVSAWIARAGGHPIGLDVSGAQLETARALQDEFGLRYPLVHAAPYFGMHRVEWPDDPGVEFHLPVGEWIRLLRANGFVVEDLVELRPAAESTTEYRFVDIEWARNWPSEQIWRARKA